MGNRTPKSVLQQLAVPLPFFFLLRFFKALTFQHFSVGDSTLMGTVCLSVQTLRSAVSAQLSVGNWLVALSICWLAD
ncbi:Uncharacterized protein APZ42_020599 [Daphnia magna]|uniref:Uncharacterized protein n=1 Tax=Daphnia magna TaxID=35525 RepID=A0A164X7F6_9CRUS|nr:Uncharacterized protein APZ42_020599 [Daphnia magna]